MPNIYTICLINKHFPPLFNVLITPITCLPPTIVVYISMDTDTTDIDINGIKPNAQRIIPITKMIELRRKGLSYSQIGKIVGCDKSNVVRRLAAVSADIEGLDDYKSSRADIFAAGQRKIIKSITNKDIKKASLLQRVTSAGILYDKERLERGESTVNVDVSAIAAGINARAKQVKALDKELADLLGGSDADSPIIDVSP